MRDRVRGLYFSSPHLILAWILIDQEVVAKLAEMDFIVADLERANSRVAAIERRNVIQLTFYSPIRVKIGSFFP